MPLTREEIRAIQIKTGLGGWKTFDSMKCPKCYESCQRREFDLRHWMECVWRCSECSWMSGEINAAAVHVEERDPDKRMVVTEKQKENDYEV